MGNEEAAAAAADATDPTNGGRPFGILDPLCRGAGLAATEEAIGTGGVPAVLFGGVIGDDGTAARTIASRCSPLCFRCRSVSAICSASAGLICFPPDPFGLKGERVCCRDLTAVGTAVADDEEATASTNLTGGTHGAYLRMSAGLEGDLGLAFGGPIDVAGTRLRTSTEKHLFNMRCSDVARHHLK
ncbi:MAG: hypothetical protein ACKPKO_05595, partial [Candidatus Fonsibacter sp.]